MPKYIHLYFIKRFQGSYLSLLTFDQSMDGVTINHAINSSMSTTTIFPFVLVEFYYTTHVPHLVVPWAVLEA